EMSVLPDGGDCRFNAHSFVRDTDRQVPGVADFDLQSSAAGVHARIANGLIANPVDLISDRRMQLSSATGDGQRGPDGTLPSAGFNRATKRVRKIAVKRLTPGSRFLPRVVAAF